MCVARTCGAAAALPTATAQTERSASGGGPSIGNGFYGLVPSLVHGRDDWTRFITGQRTPAPNIPIDWYQPPQGPMPFPRPQVEGLPAGTPLRPTPPTDPDGTPVFPRPGAWRPLPVDPQPWGPPHGLEHGQTTPTPGVPALIDPFDPSLWQREYRTQPGILPEPILRNIGPIANTIARYGGPTGDPYSR